MAFPDYKTLKDKYDSTKPIRGDVNKTRPFDKRRRKHEHMVLKDNGDIQIVCYTTPVITVHPDSSFSICHGGWETPTTTNFMRFCMDNLRPFRNGVACGAFKSNNTLWLRQKAAYSDVKTMPITKDPIRYVFNPASGLHEPETNPTRMVVRRRTDKEKWKEAKYKCREFLEWLNTFGKLLEGTRPESGDGKVVDFRRSMLASLPSSYISCAEKHPDNFAVKWVTGNCTDDYLELMWIMRNGDFNYKQVKSRVHTLLKYMFDAYVYEREEVEYKIDREAKG